MPQHSAAGGSNGARLGGEWYHLLENRGEVLGDVDHAAILAAPSDIGCVRNREGCLPPPRYRDVMDELTYDEVGATAGRMPPGYHHVRARRVVGHGREDFARAADALLAGEAQRRAGARVEFSHHPPMRQGSRVTMRLGFGILSFRIPCLVVWAERTETLAGFAYGTLPGHPERGEERFTLTLAPSGDVVFDIAAFSSPGRWFTRLGTPVGRRVQSWMTQRYLRALDTR